MATIYFNDKTYVLKDGALNAAETELRNHLTTVMNGTGAVVRLGNVDYNVDVNKLNAAAADLEVAFGELSGSSEPQPEIYDGLEFTLNNNGTYELTRISELASTDVTIPSEINGIPVTSIGANAFEGCPGLKTITIPDGVSIIGDYAFADCPYSREDGFIQIELPTTITEIGNYAFANFGAAPADAVQPRFVVLSAEFRYKGTMAQWSTIKLGESWNAGMGANSVLCSDGSIYL